MEEKLVVTFLGIIIGFIVGSLKVRFDFYNKTGKFIEDYYNEIFKNKQI